jgi:hypothetical protein
LAITVLLSQRLDLSRRPQLLRESKWKKFIINVAARNLRDPSGQTMGEGV